MENILGGHPIESHNRSMSKYSVPSGSMIDMNAVVNPDFKNITPAARQMLAWKATGKVRSYNIGVMTKNTVQPQDLNEARKKQDLHKSIMTSEEKRFTETLEGKTYRDVLAHFKKRNIKMIRHIMKAGMDF